MGDIPLICPVFRFVFSSGIVTIIPHFASSIPLFFEITFIDLIYLYTHPAQFIIVYNINFLL